MKHYLVDSNEVISSLGSNKSGLTDTQASENAEKYGKNKLAAQKKKSVLRRFLEQLSDPMIIILIIAGIISGVSGEVADMIIILLVVIINSILGVYQEGKAEKAIEALQQLSAPFARVRRNGNVMQIKSEDIVPGDIILLEAGDAVPADMRLIESASLKIEEAALTGESVPSEKDASVIETSNDDVPLGDRRNMAYNGSAVVYGRGEGVVIGTGMNTEMGRIADIISKTDSEKTPLQKKLSQLSKILSIAVLGICVFIFAYGYFIGKNEIFPMFLTAISLAVAAIPEGLVAVVTVVLSIGVTNMSKRNAIIRKLTAVETLGCAQIICSDKTGTLTQNKMTVVDSMGYEKLLAEAMALCTDAQVSTIDGSIIGEPTEVALVTYALGLGLNKNDLQNSTPRAGEAPFDSMRKMMSTIHRVGDGFVQYTKGAPDEVLKKCASILMDGEIKPLTQEILNSVINKNKEMADKALRVLAVAYKKIDSLPTNFEPDNIENELIFIGLTGMIDPVRPEVLEAIKQCKRSGIRAIMITGDHRDTAIAIAKEIGIITDESQAITGADLEKMSAEEFDRVVEHYSVYARVQPEHKVRIVNAWKRKGKITAMTGDGVNDAPALKAADIGVGMGITGTDVSKSVSDMVLADDNFASIVSAVEEGRRIYDNIRKSIQFLLGSNLSEVVALFTATIFNFNLFAPIHILWINLVTDTFPAIALGVEHAEDDIMSRNPREANEGIFAGGMAFNVIYQGVVVAILTLVSYFIGNAQDHVIGMTMAFVTLSMCEIFHSYNMRSQKGSIFKLKKKNKVLTGAMIISFVLTVVLLYTPGLNTAFSLKPLPLVDFVCAMGLAIVIIPIVEVVKIFQRKLSK